MANSPSCVVNIRTTLAPLFPAGGVWTYQGYNVASDTGPWNGNPAVPIVLSTPGTVVAGGDNFAIGTEGKTAGFYKFIYTKGNTSLGLVIKIVSDTITSGVSADLTVSTSDSPVNLLTYLTGATGGGTWEDLDGAGANFSNGTLTPSGLTPGFYRFSYTHLPVDYDNKGCVDCPVLTSVVQVDVVNGLDGQITATPSTCVYTLTCEHPDTAAADKAKIEVVADSFFPSVTTRMKVDKCGEEVANRIETVYHPSTRYWVGRRLGNNALTNTGYFQYATLFDTQSIGVVIPLAPSGTYQATFTGSAGTITANELVYTGVNGIQVRNALKIAISNYMESLNYTYGVEYESEVDYLGTGYFQIYMAAKHNPTGLWFGIASLTVKTNSGAIDTSSSLKASAVAYGLNIPRWSNQICPLTLNYVIRDFSFISSATEYNNIVLSQTDPVSLIKESSSNTVATCSATQLTANPINCSGSTTYLWSNGKTTQSIKVADIGTYTVTITCTNPADSVTKQYIKSTYG